MHLFVCRRRLTNAIVPLAIAVLVVACGGGARPTLTGERLVETAVTEPTPRVERSDPAESAATVEPPVTDAASPDAPPVESAPVVEQLTVTVLETLPHDTAAFTQGLELHDGLFIESTGQRGESDIRRVVPATGEVTQIVEVPEPYFAEGLTIVGGEVIQLTWQENTAFYRDIATFDIVREVAYEGEGWGICYDGTRLVMTDGTPFLIFRDPATFAETGRIPVTFFDQPVFSLNEIECVDGDVWANIWQTDQIARIDPASGYVTGLVDAASLRTQDMQGAASFNGIAFDATTDSFYVTGKYWPVMYRVVFEPS